MRMLSKIITLLEQLNEEQLNTIYAFVRVIWFRGL